MKITRPDTTSMILAAICVVAIAVLAVLRIPIPDVLSGATFIALGIGGGTSLNSPSTTSPTDSAAQRIADSLASLEQLIGGARRSSPAPARPSAPAQGIPTQAGPATAAATPVGTP